MHVKFLGCLSKCIFDELCVDYLTNLTPSHGLGALVGENLLFPTGGVAYGIPRYTSIGFKNFTYSKDLISPWVLPYLVMTIRGLSFVFIARKPENETKKNTKIMKNLIMTHSTRLRLHWFFFRSVWFRFELFRLLPWFPIC